MSIFYRELYWRVQNIRGGATKAMVRRATSLLDADRHSWEEHVLSRLRAVHGSVVDWAWLAGRPVVERTELLGRAHQAAKLGGRGVATRRTSGSTGTPFVFPKDRIMTAWMDAAMWAVYDWHGVRPGQPHARFWGAPVQWRKRLGMRLRDWSLHRRRVGAFDLSPKRAAQHFKALQALRPVYAYGYPTLMRTFAHLCREQSLDGRDLGIQVVISTGEILLPGTGKELRDFFGCRVVNEYGCTESGVLGFECEEGTMHAVPVAAWPEVVNDSGSPAASGEEGEIVVSDLFGGTMPLLRYRLHDRGIMDFEPCNCGRKLPRLRVTSGRSDSFIETPSGPIYDAILAYTVPAAVQRFKVYQTAPDHLEAYVVPGAGFIKDQTPRECARTWEEALGPGMTVNVRTVHDVPLEPSGKLRYFVPLSN